MEKILCNNDIQVWLIKMDALQFMDDSNRTGMPNEISITVHRSPGGGWFWKFEGSIALDPDEIPDLKDQIDRIVSELGWEITDPQRPEVEDPEQEEFDKSPARDKEDPRVLSPSVRVNLNADVKLQLTSKGKEIWEAHCRAHDPHGVAFYGITYPDTFTLWEVMEVFGPHLHPSCAIPFKENVVEIMEWS